MKAALTLYFDEAERQFAQALETRLQESHVAVHLFADHQVDKQSGPDRHSPGFVGVILTSKLVASDQARASLAEILRREIEQEKKELFVILRQDCPIPPFLRDKRYADCRTGVNRRALEQILEVVGGRYKPFRNPKKQGPFDPMHWAEKEFLKLRQDKQRYMFATALQASISQPIIKEKSHLAIPTFITEEYGIALANQHSQGLALSWKGMETYLQFTQKVPGRARGLERRYQDIFNRSPAKGTGSPYYYILSYGEAAQFGRFSFELTLPAVVKPYVMLDRLPEFVTVTSSNA
jgi:hypothetical protein